MPIDEYFYLKDEEFIKLSDKEKLEYIASIKKVMEELNVLAEKNCAGCEQYHIEPGDINIDLLMEDYRDCKEHCDKCNKESRVNMCELQYELISLIAEEIGSLTNKFNGLMRYLLKKDDKSKNVLDKLTSDMMHSRKSISEVYT